MLSMRLMRFGAKKKPSYRIVVMEAKSPRQGQVREFLGTYDPLQDPPLVQIQADVELKQAPPRLVGGEHASVGRQRQRRRIRTSQRQIDTPRLA